MFSDSCVVLLGYVAHWRCPWSSWEVSQAKTDPCSVWLYMWVFYWAVSLLEDTSGQDTNEGFECFSHSRVLEKAHFKVKFIVLTCIFCHPRACSPSKCALQRKRDYMFFFSIFGQSCYEHGGCPPRPIFNDAIARSTDILGALACKPLHIVTLYCYIASVRIMFVQLVLEKF